MHSIASLAALLLTLSSGLACAAVQLSLKDAAMVRGPRVSLGDVAAFGGNEQGAWPALAAVDLGAAPLPGYTARLSRTEIARLVRARGLAQGVSWQGNDAVRIERIATLYDSKNIALSAEHHLRRQLDGTRAELQLSGPLTDFLLPDGLIELRPRPITPAQALRRQVTVWVDIVIDGAPFRTVGAPFNVRAYRPVLVARRDLPPGALPQCDTLSVREEDVAALDSVALAADCGAVRGRLKHALPQGAPLLKSHLQIPLAVAQGDSVSLRMTDGAILLESRATALADGEIGQRIDVRPSAGSAVVSAEIIAPGLVKLTGK